MPGKFSASVTHAPEIDSQIVRLQYKALTPDKNITVEIAPEFGSNLYKYQLGEHDLIYCDPELLKDRDWTGAFVLWPLPNRVSRKQYEFEGRMISLEDIKRKKGNWPLIHGLVDDQAWRVAEPQASADKAEVQTWIEITPDSPLYKYYPFASKLTLHYTLTDQGIRIGYKVENKGDQNMPFGFALHPYFSTLSGLQNTQVLLPADYVMEADEDLLPSGQLTPAEQMGHDLRQPTSIKDLQLDHVFTGLQSGSSAQILYPTQNLKLTLKASDDFTHIVLYTLESGKGFICFENQTGSTDMINLHTRAQKENDKDLEKAAHLLILPSGQTHSGYIAYKLEAL